MDAGGGASQVRGANPFFTTSESTLNVGVALNFTAAVQLTRVNSRGRVFFGASHRYLTASDNQAEFGLQTTYPVLRFAFPGLFLTLGATPIVWRKDTATGVDGWHRVLNSVSYLAEVGIEYGLSPEASLIAAGTGQIVSLAGQTSPKPSFDLTAQIRIYFFPRSSGDSSSSSSDYLDGWRYPFGVQRN